MTAFTLIIALLTFCAILSVVKPLGSEANRSMEQLESAFAAGAYTEIPAANIDIANPSGALNMIVPPETTKAESRQKIRYAGE
ncbi:MAG TPA: hypothetical protein VKV74_05765 [Bryobacteraceae bacterium]|nr:hypothetical protein [Bryobacteraceae bacterium]